MHGHFLLSENIGRFAMEIVTMMREPAARAVSNLRQAIDTGTATTDVNEWLDGPLARKHATVALRYLSGRQAVPREDEAEALAVAVRRLELISLTGFIEDTRQAARARAGWAWAESIWDSRFRLDLIYPSGWGKEASMDGATVFDRSSRACG